MSEIEEELGLNDSFNFRVASSSNKSKRASKKVGKSKKSKREEIVDLDDGELVEVVSTEPLNVLPEVDFANCAFAHFSDVENNSHEYIQLEALQKDASHERYVLEAKLGGLDTSCLLDTGASHTVIDFSLVSDLENKGLKYYPYKYKQVATLADESHGFILGHIFVPINIGKKGTVIDCPVLDGLSHKCILGIDFCKAVKLTIECGSDRVFAQDAEGKVEIPVYCCGFKADSVNEGLPTECVLSSKEKADFGEFLDEYKVKFEKSPGRTDIVKHKIQLLPGTLPIKQACYPVSPPMEEIIHAEVTKLLDKGLIRESSSPWSSPTVLVSKKTGGYRLCIDFRKVNSVTQKHAYPAPMIEHILNQTKNAFYISTLDLLSGFHQIELEEESKPITAFSVSRKGLYEYNVMPFGISNAPGSFQQLMDKVLRPLIGSSVFDYIDDIIIIGETLEEHNENLKKVFDLLLEAKLAINWEKSVFLKPYVNYLGFIVGQGQIIVSKEKIQAILDMKPPKNVKMLQSFLGTCQWYRRFIKDLSTIASPLYTLTRKGARWDWNRKCEEAFRLLKDSLVNAPILHAPDFDYPFEVHTDASDLGLGAVLVQKVEGELRTIAYLSRTLNRAERNYHTTEKECLAVIHAISSWRPYLEGYHFTVITDHSRKK